MDLVSKNDPAFAIDAEFIFGIRKDQASLRRKCLAAREEEARAVADTHSGQPSVSSLRSRNCWGERLIMSAVRIPCWSA